MNPRDRAAPSALRQPVLSGELVPAPARPVVQRSRTGVVVDGRTVPRTTPRRARRRGPIVAGAVVAVGAVLAGAGFAVAWLVSVVVVSLPAILGGVAVLLAVLYGLGRVGVCPGLHCPGCRHH